MADAADAVWRWQFRAVGCDRSTFGIWTAKLDLIDAEASEKKVARIRSERTSENVVHARSYWRHLTPPQFD